MRSLLLLTAVLLPLAADAGLAAAPSPITDGDTLRFGEERVRLWGIDAPELLQRCTLTAGPTAIGEASRDHLASLIDGGDVQCAPRNRDRYGQIVAVCSVGNEDLGARMVEDGWAFDAPDYSDGAYADRQLAAMAAARGLWAGDHPCENPANWRRDH